MNQITRCNVKVVTHSNKTQLNKKAKTTVHQLPSTKWHTAKVSN